MLKIALLGVADSGKAELAVALSAALRAAGTAAIVMSIDKLTHASDLAIHNLVLLTGLQSEAGAKSAQKMHEMQVADQHIREMLDQASISYEVLYGASEERLGHALIACGGPRKPMSHLGEKDLQGSSLGNSIGGSANGKTTRQWTWMCDKCSDPVCEHRLLSDLLASRAAKG